MIKLSMIYEGELRCRVIHEPSGNEILTDAPVDNMGKGEAFSPTDLVAAALGSCMLTVIGITAQKNNIDLTGTTAEVTKEMATSPVRRIGKMAVTIYMASGINRSKRSILDQAAQMCPVYKSIHPSVSMPVKFIYPD